MLTLLAGAAMLALVFITQTENRVSHAGDRLCAYLRNKLDRPL